MLLSLMGSSWITSPVSILLKVLIPSPPMSSATTSRSVFGFIPVNVLSVYALLTISVCCFCKLLFKLIFIPNIHFDRLLYIYGIKKWYKKWHTEEKPHNRELIKTDLTVHEFDHSWLLAYKYTFMTKTNFMPWLFCILYLNSFLHVVYFVLSWILLKWRRNFIKLKHENWEISFKAFELICEKCGNFNRNLIL